MLVSASQPIEGVYSTDLRNGTILLTINPLCPTFTGSYTCVVTNTLGTGSGITTVYGPPPPPTLSYSNVKVNGSTVTITLEKSVTHTVVTHYLLIVYRFVSFLYNINFI